MAVAALLGAVWTWARPGKGAAACAGLAVIPVALLAGVAVPGLRALSGPPLLALFAAGLAVVWSAARRRPGPRVFLPFILVLYALSAAQAQRQVGPEGDEPHYLMVADSLLRDGDLALEEDYAQGRYWAFSARHIEPHYRVRGKDGRVYSLHAVGLSLLILPAFALGGYPAVSFFMALLTAWLAWEIRELLREAKGDSPLAEGLGWVLALGPPLIHYAGLVFTEVPAGLVVAAALRRGRDLRSASAWSCLALGAALAFLPWLNVRYAPLAAVLLAYWLLGRPGRLRACCLTTPIFVSALGIALYHVAIYGFWDPRLVYGRRPGWALRALPEGLQGLALDQEFGLLVYAPVFALALPGALGLLRSRSRMGLAAIAAVGVVVLSAGSWHMWRGGWNPPARFLVPVVPCLALCSASSLRRGLGSAPALLVGWTLFTGLTGAAQPRLVHRDRDGTAPLFRSEAGAEEWTRLLPGYVLSEPDRHRLAWVWCGVLALAALAGGRGRPKATGLAAASLVLLAAAGAAAALSDARTLGRDAVRVVGRPALLVPGWTRVSKAEGCWLSRDLEWGPAYQPHRHPAGVTLGGRLSLPPGRYELAVEVDRPPDAAPPWLEVRAEGPASRPRASRLIDQAGGWRGGFEVAPQDRAVTLILKGGGSFRLGRVRLRSTF